MASRAVQDVQTRIHRHQVNWNFLRCVEQEDRLSYFLDEVRIHFVRA